MITITTSFTLGRLNGEPKTSVLTLDKAAAILLWPPVNRMDSIYWCKKQFVISKVGGSCRVTLVVDFGFLSQNFGRWWGPMNDTLSFYECRLSGGDTQTPLGVIKPPCETFTTFHLIFSWAGNRGDNYWNVKMNLTSLCNWDLPTSSCGKFVWIRGTVLYETTANRLPEACTVSTILSTNIKSFWNWSGVRKFELSKTKTISSLQPAGKIYDRVVATAEKMML